MPTDVLASLDCRGRRSDLASMAALSWALLDRAPLAWRPHGRRASRNHPHGSAACHKRVRESGNPAWQGETVGDMQ
jgi:hypothetical protein